MAKQEYNDERQHKLVQAIPTGNFTELRVVAVSGDLGVEAVDIRSWYCTRKDPEMKPSTKGVRLSIDNAEKLRDALLRVLEEVK